MSRITFFKLYIVPHYMGDCMRCEVQIQTDLIEPEIVSKVEDIPNHYFESDLERIMGVVFEEIRDYMRKKKEDHEIRSMGLNEIRAHIEEKLQEPRKKEDS